MLYNYIKHGKLERSEGSSIAEGIGQGRVTANLKDAPIDDAHTILDTDAVKMVVYTNYYNYMDFTQFKSVVIWYSRTRWEVTV